MFQLYVYLCLVCRCTTLPVQWNMYVRCGNHIYSVVYVKYVYSTHCHMGDCSDFICEMCIHLPYKPIKYLAYMPSSVGMLVSNTYLAIRWEECIAVGCVLANMCVTWQSRCIICLLCISLSDIWQCEIVAFCMVFWTDILSMSYLVFVLHTNFTPLWNHYTDST